MIKSFDLLRCMYLCAAHENTSMERHFSALFCCIFYCITFNRDCKLTFITLIIINFDFFCCGAENSAAGRSTVPSHYEVQCANKFTSVITPSSRVLNSDWLAARFCGQVFLYEVLFSSNHYFMSIYLLVW